MSSRLSTFSATPTTSSIPGSMRVQRLNQSFARTGSRSTYQQRTCQAEHEPPAVHDVEALRGRVQPARHTPAGRVPPVTSTCIHTCSDQDDAPLAETIINHASALTTVASPTRPLGCCRRRRRPSASASSLYPLFPSVHLPPAAALHLRSNTAAARPPPPPPPRPLLALGGLVEMNVCASLMVCSREAIDRAIDRLDTDTHPLRSYGLACSPPCRQRWRLAGCVVWMRERLVFMVLWNRTALVCGGRAFRFSERSPSASNKVLRLILRLHSRFDLIGFMHRMQGNARSELLSISYLAVLHVLVCRAASAIM